MIDLLLKPRERDLGGFSVRRVLPFAKRRLVGPFVFFDHMGPADFAPGQGINVRPHPHIGLATVTYLFDGEILHRDSLGFEQTIAPGAVNWMTAGSGIVHSERTTKDALKTGYHLNGIQSWIALPKAHEETDPSFVHHPADTLPQWEEGGAKCTLIAGEAFGYASPVRTFSPLFYVDAKLRANASLLLPDFHERAVYVAKGRAQIEGAELNAGTMAVLTDGSGQCVVKALEGCRLMLLGGDSLDGTRTIFWNFVHSDPARIEAAKRLWEKDGFPKVPGETERILLPGP